MSDHAKTSTSNQSHNGGMGLSLRLFAFTLLFVFGASIVLYIPALVNFRNGWLDDRLAQARTAALILQNAAPGAIPKPIIAEMLAGMDTSTIALRQDQSRQLVAMTDIPPMVNYEIDLRRRDWAEEIRSTFDTLLFGGHRAIRVVGRAPMGAEFVEIVILERAMWSALVSFSINALSLVLILSVLTAALIYGMMNALIIRPVKTLAHKMLHFSAFPNDSTALLAPRNRADEIGTLEHTLADMQHILQKHLRQRERLANLGLAVAKINHDLRNMLASAQLIADRLSAVPDADVQRFSPKLCAALDRAINFCQTSLTYGKVQERAPQPVKIVLKPFLQELGESMALVDRGNPILRLNMDDKIAVFADEEHLLRVLNNLFRNAIAVIPSRGGQILVSARCDMDDAVILVQDNGPGVPAAQNAVLFQAFSHSTKQGGSGLGLSIALELMQAMGGSLTLVDRPVTSDRGEQPAPQGACFRLSLPRA